MSNKIESHDWVDGMIESIDYDGEGVADPAIQFFFKLPARSIFLDRDDIIRCAKHFNLTPEDIEQ